MESSDPGPARAAPTPPNKSPCPRATDWHGAIGSSSVSPSTARAMTRTGCRSPAIWSGTRGTDTAEQVTVSAGYGLAWRDRLQLRFALHRTRYDKDVLSIAGDLVRHARHRHRRTSHRVRGLRIGMARSAPAPFRPPPHAL